MKIVLFCKFLQRGAPMNNIGLYQTILRNAWQYYAMLDNIGKYLTIFGNIYKFKQYQKKIERWNSHLNDIELYWAIFYNIAQYCTILDNSWQYLKISHNIVVYLAISEVISCHRGKVMLFQTFPFLFFFFSHGRVLEELLLLKMEKRGKSGH